MALPVIVVGAGGHAKVVLAALEEAGFEVQGMIDADATRIGRRVLGVPVLGDDGILAGYTGDTIGLVNGIGSTGRADTRIAVFERFHDLGFVFVTIVHPRAFVAADVEIAEGAQVMAGAIIQPGCRIGENAIVNTGARIDHDCIIGAHAHIAPGAVLCGGVTVGRGAHVGAGSTVIQNIEIGPRGLVGAGAVVVAAVGTGSTVVGVPARKV